MVSPAAETAETTTASETHTPKELARLTVEANIAHQFALTKYTEQLEQELLRVDKLLSVAETPDQDDELDLDVGGTVYVAGAKKAVGPLLPGDLLSPSSPFFDEASKRTQYMNYVTTHPMKSNELEALEEGVKAENRRLQAVEAQKRGQDALRENIPSEIDIIKNTEGLDWNRIAERVSMVVDIPRTANECQIRWLSDKHPDINHEPWTPTELENLKTLISDKFEGEIDWVDVAEKLGTNRVPIDCMRHAIPRPHHTWDADSDRRLLDAVNMYGKSNWIIVARRVGEAATAGQCQSRYSRSLDPTIKRGHWSEEEDNRLRLAVAAYGNSWMEVASAIPGRTNDQCRDHWSERLDTTIVKGAWTDDENQSLVDAVKDLGRKWKAISQRLGNGRTDQNCRLHYEQLKKQNPQLTFPRAGPSKSGSGSTEAQMAGDAPSAATSSRTQKSKLPVASHLDNDPTAEQPAPRPRPKPKLQTKSTSKEHAAVVQTSSFIENERALGSASIPSISAPASTAGGGEMDVDRPAENSNLSTVPAKGRKKRTAAAGETGGVLAKKRKTNKRQDNDVDANADAHAPGNGDAEKASLGARSSMTTTTRKPGRPRKTPRTESRDEDEVGVEPATPTRTSPRKAQGRAVPTTASLQEPIPVVTVNLKETQKGKAKAGEPIRNVEEVWATEESVSAPKLKPKPRDRPRKMKPTLGKDTLDKDQTNTTSTDTELNPTFVPTKGRWREAKVAAVVEP